MVIPIIVSLIIISSVIEILLIYQLSKNRHSKRKEYIESFGYKYIGSDNEFERSVLKGVLKTNPALRWLSVRINDIFTTEDTEKKRFYFEMYVSNRYYSQKYFCMLLKDVTLSIPISEFAIVPRVLLSKMFMSKKDAFSRQFIIKPKQIIDNIPYDLKEQLMRFNSVSIVYKDKELLISKVYSHRELPIEALKLCEEVYEYIKTSLQAH
ncbi:hypothetical protein [Fervidobacterium sp.]